jgi:hypothetical protein
MARPKLDDPTVPISFRMRRSASDCGRPGWRTKERRFRSSFAACSKRWSRRCLPTTNDCGRLRRLHHARPVTIVRDPRNREIELAPEPEVPARLGQELHQLWQGLSRIGANRQQVHNVVRSAALGSIPKQRRLALNALLGSCEPLGTAQVAVRTGTPESSIPGPLEDLATLGVIHCSPAQPPWDTHV